MNIQAYKKQALEDIEWFIEKHRWAVKLWDDSFSYFESDVIESEILNTKLAQPFEND